MAASKVGHTLTKLHMVSYELAKIHSVGCHVGQLSPYHPSTEGDGMNIFRQRAVVSNPMQQLYGYFDSWWGGCQNTTAGDLYISI